LAQISTEKYRFNQFKCQKEDYTTQSAQLTLKTAFQITDQAQVHQQIGKKNVTIAVLDIQGKLSFFTWRRSWDYNTEAARRKYHRIIY
jgi:hypothetical protein